MHQLTIDDPVQVILSHSLYIGARARAVPDLKAAAEDVRKPRAGYKKAIGERNDREDDLEEANAGLDSDRDALYDAVKDFGKKLAGHLPGAEDAPGYRRIFQQSPSELHKSPKDAWKPNYEQFLARLDDPQTPKEGAVGRTATAIHKQWDAYLKGEAEASRAAYAYGQAVVAEATAKSAVVSGFHSLLGKIHAHCADEPDKIERFGKALPKKKKAKKEDPKVVELQKKNDELTAQVADLTRQVAQLSALLTELKAANDALKGTSAPTASPQATPVITGAAGSLVAGPKDQA